MNTLSGTQTTHTVRLCVRVYAPRVEQYMKQHNITRIAYVT